MSDYTLTIKSDEKKGVLDDITDVITSHGANISYVHLFVEKNNVGSINLELDHVEDIDELVSDFYTQVYGCDISEEEAAIMRQVAVEAGIIEEGEA